MTTAAAPSGPLTAVDRATAAAPRPTSASSSTSGGELLFCAHHAREHGDKLREIAVHVHDETGKLADTPATATEDER